MRQKARLLCSSILICPRIKGNGVPGSSWDAVLAYKPFVQVSFRNSVSQV